MTPLEALEMFEEMPRKVQAALISNLHGFRSRGSLSFSDYPIPVAEYISASQLMTVKISDNGGVRFSANDNTVQLKTNLRKLLEVYGIEFKQ